MIDLFVCFVAIFVFVIWLLFHSVFHHLSTIDYFDLIDDDDVDVVDGDDDDQTMDVPIPMNFSNYFYVHQQYLRFAGQVDGHSALFFKEEKYWENFHCGKFSGKQRQTNLENELMKYDFVPYRLNYLL